MDKNKPLCMSFVDCCKTVRDGGLRMIRPSKNVPGQYDLCEPFEGGGDWIWLDAFTANAVCQVYEALSAETQEKFKKDTAEHILNLCWKVIG